MNYHYNDGFLNCCKGDYFEIRNKENYRQAQGSI